MRDRGRDQRPCLAADGARVEDFNGDGFGGERIATSDQIDVDKGRPGVRESRNLETDPALDGLTRRNGLRLSRVVGRPAGRQNQIGRDSFDRIPAVCDLERKNHVTSRLSIEWSLPRAKADAAHERDVYLHGHDEGRGAGRYEMRFRGDHTAGESSRRNPDCDADFFLSGPGVHVAGASTEHREITAGHDDDFDAICARECVRNRNRNDQEGTWRTSRRDCRQTHFIAGAQLFDRRCRRHSLWCGEQVRGRLRLDNLSRCNQRDYGGGDAKRDQS